MMTLKQIQDQLETINQRIKEISVEQELIEKLTNTKDETTRQTLFKRITELSLELDFLYDQLCDMRVGAMDVQFSALETMNGGEQHA